MSTMQWYRETTREGETSRIRTSSGSYTIIGTTSGAEGKTFGLFNSAGQPVGYRRTQRDAKALAEDYAATQARVQQTEGRPLRAAVDQSAGDALRKAFDDAIKVVEQAIVSVEPTVPQLAEALVRRHRAEVAEAIESTHSADRIVDYRTAFDRVSLVMVGWVEGAQSNHVALDHRADFYECTCSAFTPDDIRHMLDDARRELGVIE